MTEDDTAVHKNIAKTVADMQTLLTNYTLGDLISEKNLNGSVRYNGGGEDVVSLDDHERLSICLAVYPAGSSLDEHSHDAREYIIVRDGEMIFNIVGKALIYRGGVEAEQVSGDVVVKEQDLLIIPNKVAHSVKDVPRAAVCVGNTLPREPAYPYGQR